MPLVQPATLLKVAKALQSNEVALLCFEMDVVEQRGHPVGVAAVCQQDLLILSKNKGEYGVINTYNAMKLIVNDVGIVTDIDTLEDLAPAESLLGHR